MALLRLRNESEKINNPDSKSTLPKLPEGCMAEPIDGNLFHWRALIIGPKGTCYEDGHFYLDATFPADYPFKPPSITCTTKIYHPRVSPDGQICALGSLLSDNWSPRMTFGRILAVIRDILLNPDEVEDSTTYDVKMADQLKSNRKLFDDTAAKWVSEHAPPPKHPVIEHLKYEYSISEQHVLCTFNVSFARCELQKSETYHLRTQYNDKKIEVELQREHNEYSVAMPITMEYGGMLSIESCLCLDSDSVPFTTQHHELYLNALTDQEYVLLIFGFWRECCPEMEINLDLVGVCDRFYDHRFEITMRWKIHQNSATFIEERTIRLTDSKYINISWCERCQRQFQCTKWIKETFLRLFGMGSIVVHATLWNSHGTINIVSESVSDFMKAPYPKTVDIQMDFSKIACFDVKYENQIKRVAIVRSEPTLSWVKEKVLVRLFALQITDKSYDWIQLTINGKSIQTDHEMETYLFQNEKIMICDLQIIAPPEMEE